MFSVGLALMLTGCKVVVLQPKGLVSTDEMHLFFTALVLMLIIVIPVILMILWTARRYRASNKNATYTPNWSHSTLLEFIWWMVPIIIIAVLAVVTWITTHALDPYKPLNVSGKPLTIQVVALRWRWLFIYPQQHIATVDYVRFPVHTQVKFEITSDAPMNSFQIPALGGQIYAMNGMETKLHLFTNNAGVYNGRSVSFSGNGFANMKFKAHVTSVASFNKWVRAVRKVPHSLTWANYKKLSQPTKSHTPLFFTMPAKGLFEKVIDIYMPANKQAVDKKSPAVHL